MVQYSEDNDYKEKEFLKENKSEEGKYVIYLPNFNTISGSWRLSFLVQTNVDH